MLVHHLFIGSKRVGILKEIFRRRVRLDGMVIRVVSSLVGLHRQETRPSDP
jgi:hypothetical protein